MLEIRRRPSPLPLLVMVALAGEANLNTAWAQAAPVPLQTVEVSGSRQDQRRNDTTAKVVVQRSELLRYGDSSLGEALKRLPGVTVSGDVRMRGLGSGYTQILVNGDATPPGFSIDTITPEMIERVEILRSATVEYGTQAIAGTINIVLRKSVNKLQREVKLGAERASGAAVGPELTLGLADRDEDFSYTVTGNLRQKKTLETPHIEDRSVNAAGALTELFRVREHNRDATDMASLTPRLNWKRSNGDLIGWQGFFDVRRNVFTSDMYETLLLGEGSRFPVTRGTTDSLTSTVRNDVNWVVALPERAKLSLKLGANLYRRNRDYEFLGLGADLALQERHDVRSTQDDAAFLSVGKYTRPLGSGHQLALGWDASRTRRGESRFERRFDPAQTVLGEIDENYDAIVEKVAFYAQDEWDLSPRWQVYLGLRWDGLFTHSTSNIVREVSNRAAVWSPVLQTLWKLPGTEKDQLRLALTRTYKAPATASLIPRRYIVYNNNAPTNPSRQGNPGLRPELAWGLDLAYEHYLGKDGLLSASAFTRRITDVTIQRLYRSEDVWISSPDNGGRARVSGVELEARLPLSMLAASAPPVEVRANLAWNWSSQEAIQRANDRLDGQTPFSANLGLDYRASQRLSLGGNYHFERAAPVSLSDYLGKYLGPVRVLDLYGVWKFHPKMLVRISVNGALRGDAVSAISYADPDGATERRTVLERPRTLKFVFEHAF